MKTLYGNALVNELRFNCDKIIERLWIAVPFIGSLGDVQRILGRQWIDNSNLSVRLLTDTSEINNFSSETIGMFQKIGYIKHISGLHAKIFIADGKCLITSANLTKTAFSKRHEIGIFLDEKEALDAITIFNEWWDKSENVFTEFLQSIVQEGATSKEEKGGNRLPFLWDLPEIPRNIQYWLKPVGVTDDPITEDQLFDSEEEDHHFAIEPSGVRIGDILIAYGIGAKRLLSVYQVTSEGELVPETEREEWMERWPWYVTSINLSRDFGRHWATHNLYASSILRDYLSNNPQGFITKRKGKTLGALSWGIDKINLDPEFARYVLREIMALNNNIQ